MRCDSLLGFEEDRAAVHVLPLLLRHQLGARLGTEIAVVAALRQGLQEERVVLLGFHFLWGRTSPKIRELRRHSVVVFQVVVIS